MEGVSRMITQKLIELDPTLKIHDEGEWGGTHSEFTAFNDAGLECETGEFMYAMLRLMKPERVLETGTHWGVGASYMGMALKENGKGLLDTIEFLPENHNKAVERITKLGLNDFVACHFGDVGKFNAEGKYDFILLDTEPQTRFAELIKFYPHLKHGGFVFIHDLHRHMNQVENLEHGFAWPYGKIPKQMNDLVTRGFLRQFHFSTPRGLTGFYKPSSDDYKFFKWD